MLRSMLECETYRCPYSVQPSRIIAHFVIQNRTTRHFGQGLQLARHGLKKPMTQVATHAWDA